jgi:elongation factor Ts
MADITAADIKRVREITGAGMSDVKKALVEADGDHDKAIEEFQQLAANIVAHAAAAKPADSGALLVEKLADGGTVEDEINVLAGTLGEKLELRRYVAFDGPTATYMHRRSSDLPPQIGVLVEFTGEGENAAEAARGAAMQIASLGAQYVTRDEVADDVVAKEREIAEATAREEGKPEAALPKIIEGRVQGFYKEVVLVEQPSVRDNKKTVMQVLDEAGVTVTRFARFEVGKA